MESRDQRIMTLATTLKSSGIAKTDSQARMMAEEMIGVEEHVQQSYEEEHVRAHEYLQTAKNLRVPRPASASELVAMQSSSEQKSEQKSVPSKVIEPLAPRSQPNQNVRNVVSNSDSETENVENTPRSSSSLNFTARNNDSSSHNTHNAALEAIKSLVQTEDEDTIPLKDQMSSKQATLSDAVHEEDFVDAADIVEDSTDSASVDTKVSEPMVPVTIPKEVAEEVVIDERLDAKKLVELMEEDGKLEEHTREIKEAPKNVKPKEEYAENSIDLSNVFSFNKK